MIDAFAPIPPEWTSTAIHAQEFCCPKCRATSAESERVWLNRRSPVVNEDNRRKWQEFYQCHCSCAWWAWSTDRQSMNQFIADVDRTD